MHEIRSHLDLIPKEQFVGNILMLGFNAWLYCYLCLCNK